MMIFVAVLLDIFMNDLVLTNDVHIHLLVCTLVRLMLPGRRMLLVQSTSLMARLRGLHTSSRPQWQGPFSGGNEAAIPPEFVFIGIRFSSLEKKLFHN